MCNKTSNTLRANASETILTVNLTKDKAELILIALRALDLVQENKISDNKEILAAVAKFVGLKSLPEIFEEKIGLLFDEIAEPYFEAKIKACRTADDLLTVEIEDLSSLEIVCLIDELQVAEKNEASYAE